MNSSIENFSAAQAYIAIKEYWNRKTTQTCPEPFAVLFQSAAILVDGKISCKINPFSRNFNLDDPRFFIICSVDQFHSMLEWSMDEKLIEIVSNKLFCVDLDTSLNNLTNSIYLYDQELNKMVLKGLLRQTEVLRPEEILDLGKKIENYIFICDWGMYGKFIDYNKSIAAENFIKSSFFDIDFEKLNTTIIKNMILVYNISTNKVVDAFKAFDLPYP